MILHISHGGDDPLVANWFVVKPFAGKTETSVAGTLITHDMAVGSLLNARRQVFEVDTEACTVVRLESGLGAGQISAGDS